MSDPYNDEHKIYDDFRFKNHFVTDEIHGLFQLTPGTLLFTRRVERLRSIGYLKTLSHEVYSFTVLSRDRNNLQLINTSLEQIKAFISFGVRDVSFDKESSYDRCQVVELYGGHLAIPPKSYSTQWNDDIFYVVDHVLMK